MKKIIIISMFLILMPFVLSWGATRQISGGDVTITIDNSGTNACIVAETIPSGVTITNNGGGVFQSSTRILKWIDMACPSSHSYSTSGTGRITGKITGGDTNPSTKDITGDLDVPKVVCTPVAATCSATGISCPGNTVIDMIPCTGGKICQNGACVLPMVTSDRIPVEEAVPMGCINGAVNPPACDQFSIGAKLDQELGAEKTRTDWDISFISKIAAILKGWFR